ncbi:MAG: hypothetical protein GY859_37810, partial [Desulfobacterales bacterium]|nr:hypothetical protein [Desulfobacterales bacterium]
MNIQKKMGVILVLVTTLTMSGLAAFNYFTAKSEMTRELNHISETAAVRLADNLVAPLWNMNAEETDHMLLNEMAEKRIFAIIVTGPDQKEIIAGKQRDSQWKPVDAKEALQGKFITADHVVSKGEETLGVVRLHLTPKFMNESLRRSLTTIFLGGVITNIVLVFALFMGLRRHMVRPIHQVSGELYAG